MTPETIAALESLGLRVGLPTLAGIALFFWWIPRLLDIWLAYVKRDRE
jgi:hypothetical protein